VTNVVTEGHEYAQLTHPSKCQPHVAVEGHNLHTEDNSVQNPTNGIISSTSTTPVLNEDNNMELIPTEEGSIEGTEPDSGPSRIDTVKAAATSNVATHVYAATGGVVLGTAAGIYIGKRVEASQEITSLYAAYKANEEAITLLTPKADEQAEDGFFRKASRFVPGVENAASQLKSAIARREKLQAKIAEKEMSLEAAYEAAEKARCEEEGTEYHPLRRAVLELVAKASDGSEGHAALSLAIAGLSTEELDARLAGMFSILTLACVAIPVEKMQEVQDEAKRAEMLHITHLRDLRLKLDKAVAQEAATLEAYEELEASIEAGTDSEGTADLRRELESFRAANAGQAKVVASQKEEIRKLERLVSTLKVDESAAAERRAQAGDRVKAIKGSTVPSGAAVMARHDAREKGDKGLPSLSSTFDEMVSLVGDELASTLDRGSWKGLASTWQECIDGQRDLAAGRMAKLG
jgi:hypothetical protein